MSPACLPFAFHVRVIRTTAAVSLCIPVSFSLPASVLLQPASRVLAPGFDARSLRWGEGGGYNSRRRRPRAPRRVAARLITLGRAAAIEMFN